MDKLEAVHGGATGAQEQKKTFVYDADHERRRKEQLRRLYNRTQDQLDEEEMLKGELRKIEARKKEREKKTADLQKMIAQADATNQETKKMNKKQKMVPRSGVARQVNNLKNVIVVSCYFNYVFNMVSMLLPTKIFYPDGIYICILQESVPTDTNTGIRWAEVKTSGVSCRCKH